MRGPNAITSPERGKRAFLLALRTARFPGRQVPKGSAGHPLGVREAVGTAAVRDCLEAILAADVEEWLTYGGCPDWVGALTALALHRGEKSSPTLERWKQHRSANLTFPARRFGKRSGWTEL